MQQIISKLSKICRLVASSAEIQNLHSADMAKIAEYCSMWRLQPSVTKTVSSVFHLNNFSASKELSVYRNGQRLKHDSHSVYLGVMINRSMTFHDHTKKMAAKVRTRNNLLNKLAGVRTQKLSGHRGSHSATQLPNIVHRSGVGRLIPSWLMSS